MERSDEIGDLVEALSKARLGFEPIVKDKRAKFPTKSGNTVEYRYADLATIHAATHKSLSENGLSLFSTTQMGDRSNLVVIGDLIHSSGQWIRATTELAVESLSPRSVGSATTYGRRYVTQMLLDISSDEDDDGAGAEPRGKTNEAKPSKRRAASEPAGKEPAAVEAEKVEDDPTPLSDMIDELSTADDQGTVQRRYANMLKFVAKHKDAYTADAADQLKKACDGRLATLKEYAQ